MPQHLPCIIIGAGGHAVVLLDALLLMGRAVLGLTTLERPLHGGAVFSVPILGDDSALEAHPPGDICLVNGLGSENRETAVRRARVFERFSQEGYSFASVVHPAAVISPHAALEEGAQVMAGAVIQARARIEANALINSNASVDHDAVIGRHAHVAPGATLSGGVHIGEGCLIGTGASVIQRVKVGPYSVVGAGASVVKDLPARVVAVGCPARCISDAA